MLVVGGKRNRLLEANSRRSLKSAQWLEMKAGLSGLECLLALEDQA